jgi:hypothetical protein
VSRRDLVTIICAAVMLVVLLWLVDLMVRP